MGLMKGAGEPGLHLFVRHQMTYETYVICWTGVGWGCTLCPMIRLGVAVECVASRLEVHDAAFFLIVFGVRYPKSRVCVGADVLDHG
jgi:hypothetical protein